MKSLLQIFIFYICAAHFSTLCATPIKVLVSVLPQKEMIERIGGEYVEVEVLVPKGKSPEIYEPSIAQMKYIEDSHIFFGVGMPFESAWLKRIAHINPSLIYYNLAHSVLTDNRIKGADSKHTHAHNPHIWLSPKAILPQIDIIAQTLGKLDKEHFKIFQQNATLLSDDIKAIQEHTKELFAKEDSKKSFITYHPALTYWSAEFKVKELSIENNGKEIKGRELVALMAQAKKDSVEAIFIQPEFTKSRVEMFARELDLRIIELDVLRKDWLLSLQDLACQIAFSLSAQESKSCVQKYFKD